VITWANAQEAAGMLPAMFLVFAGLWWGFPGPVFRSLMRRVSQARRDPR
jgi:hypothetical protein